MNLDETSNVVDFSCQVCLGGRFATGQLYGLPRSGLIFQLDSFFVEGRKNPGGVKPQSVKTALTVRIKYMLMLCFLILRPRF